MQTETEVRLCPECQIAQDHADELGIDSPASQEIQFQLDHNINTDDAEVVVFACTRMRHPKVYGCDGEVRVVEVTPFDPDARDEAGSRAPSVR